MIIKIKKPEYLGQIKLSPEAQRCAVKDMINRQIKLMKSIGQKVNSVIIYDNNKQYFLTIKNQTK